MRIRKRQVPLPLSSLLPVPLSDLYCNRSPTYLTRYFNGGDHSGFLSSLQLSPMVNSNQDKKKDDGVDMKNGFDASSSKNVNPLGEFDSSTQVIETKENGVSLRKRRSFVSFEEQEDDEEEGVGGGGGNQKKKKAKKSGALEEGSRCSRVNGRGWRCCQQTLVGYSLCEHHLGKGRVRSMNKSNGGRGGGRGSGEKKAVVVEVKKKRVKLGMVKARSISSLLGQTSTSGSGSGNGGEVVVVPTESEISAPADQFAASDDK